MGSNGASGGGSADPPNTERSQLSKKNQDKLTDRNQKNKTEFGYEKPTSVVNNNGGNGMNTSGVVVQAPTVVAPTTAEISQSEATKAEDPIEIRKRKTLAKGRSSTIITRSTGVTGDLTLGKPSLLGRA